MIQKLLPTALAALTLTGATAFAQDTVKVGVLHSLSGTMAISETSLSVTSCSSPSTKSTPLAA